MDLNEFQTRRQKIDVLLQEQGWVVGDHRTVIAEVDTRQSNFPAQDYKTVSETLKNDMQSKYADYLLLDGQGAPLAIIEAKRTCKDPLLTAQTQASGYADDIKAQLGSDVFIFLSNGYEIWFWDRERHGPRPVKGFFSQRDLERMRFQVKKRKSLASVEVNTDIVDRDRSVENVKRVFEHLERGHRKALIVMATGTGKTRVSMALIDGLMKQSWAQKVLFLADRRALRDQAYNDGFKVFFPEEPKTKILSGVFDRDKSLYVSTIQTFMECYNQKDTEGKNLISPGDFDVIISDEAHRSIYNKWREVFTYLDAIQIGLTATPADMIDRNTFRFFNCDDGKPTAMYDYEEAVNDGILCDFKKHILGAQTHFQLEGITKEALAQEQIDELVAKGLDPEDVSFEGTDIEKKVIVTGTNEALVREFMDTCIMDATGTLPAKTIFFAISKQHARRLYEAFEKLYPEYKGQLARVIISEDGRAQELIEKFKKESLPRIAISVDMLDTGIDVPEVCNLVFAKPVFSKIKFWQMIGRGTRSNNTCKHLHWLPGGRKEYFKIFDFWNNFEWHKMHPEGDRQETAEAITTRIFLARLKQLEVLETSGTPEAYEAVKTRILDDVRALPMDSALMRENARDIERALSPTLWDNVGVDPVEFLRQKLAPLMRYKGDVNLKEASYVNKVERLGLAVLKGDSEEIERLKGDIGSSLNLLPRTLNAVQEKEDLLDKALSTKFWSELSFDDCHMLGDEFADLMKYREDESKNPIVFDMDDVIQQRTLIEFGPDYREEYIEVYKEKVERWIRDLAEEHPTIRKIVEDEVLTELDLQQLEETLNNPELFITEDVLQKVYDQSKGTLVQFIKNILGMYSFPDPTDRVREAFDTYRIEHNKDYSADQLNFIRTIATVFAGKRHIELDDLYDAPFTNFGANAPTPMFDTDELGDFIEICNGMEKELFAQET